MAGKTESLRSKIINLIVVGALVAALLVAAMYVGRYSIPREEIIRQYHIIAYCNPAMWDLRWLGIRTTQNPNDVWIIQEIISEVRPDYIVETGTAAGGSAAIWSLVQHQVNASGRVITIDIHDSVDRQTLPQALRDHVDFVIGSSVDPKVVAAISEKVRGKRVLVLLDSNHSRSHVLRELEAYSPLVEVGSYVIVQDTNINGHPVFNGDALGPGPMEAVEEFLAANPQFQADTSREKLLFTMHPRGYLKRMR